MGNVGFGPPQPKSIEAGALGQIDSSTKSFVNKDFVKNMAWLNQSVDTLSSYTQKLQAGVDSANQNTISQVQGVLADLFVLFGGGEPTGFDFGDLKYVIQGIGAMFGINPNTPFPLNISEAIGHMFDTFMIPLPQFTDVIFDAIIAWAEELGFSDNAIQAVADFDAAVVDLYQGFDEVFDLFGDIFKNILVTLGLGSGGVNTTALHSIWTAVQELAHNLMAGPTDMLLNILSNLTVFTFKSLTWVVNLFNPSKILDATGLKGIGTELSPAVSSSTVDWTVGANQNTGWIYDATAEAFKTIGNSTTKTLLSQEITPCQAGDKFMIRGTVRHDGILPTSPNGEKFGMCVVFYTGTTQLSQINVDVKPTFWNNITHDYEMGNDTQNVELGSIQAPINADGMKFGCRVSSTVTAGNIYVNEISCTASDSIGLAIAKSILDFPHRVLENFITKLDNLVVKLFGEDTLLDRILDNIIPALDASKINRGKFAKSMIDGLEEGLSNLSERIQDNLDNLGTLSYNLWNHPAQTIGQITQEMVWGLVETIQNLTEMWQNLIDNLIDAITGVFPNLGGTLGNMVDGFRNLMQKLFGSNSPQTTIHGTAIPNIDASKINSGTLPELVIPPLNASIIQFGTIGASHVPPLDASVITTGTLSQGMVTDLTTDLENRLDYSTYQSFLSGGSSNLCSNPSFEDTKQYDYDAFVISKIGNSQYVRSGSLSRQLLGSGQSKFLELSSSKTTNIFINANPSDKFYVEIWVRGDNGNSITGTVDVVGIGLWSYTSGDVAVTSNVLYANANTIGKSGWVKVSGIITLPTTSTIAKVRPLVVLTSLVPAGNSFYFDDVAVRRVTEIVNINQSLYNADTPASTIVSNAVPLLDASKISTGFLDQEKITDLKRDLNLNAASALSGTNLIPDPGFDDSSLDTLRAATINGGTAGTWTYDDIIKYSGTRSLKCVYSSGEPGMYLSPNLKKDKKIPAKYTQIFYLSYWVFASTNNTGTNSVGLGFELYGLLGQSIDWRTDNVAVPEGVWTKVEMYLELPSNTHSILPYLFIKSASLNDIFWFDFVECYEVTEPQKLVSRLFGQIASPSTTILSSKVPGLDTSKITSGTFGNAMISDLSGSKINTGSVAANYISALDASKISTGTFAQSMVTSLTTDLSNRVDYSAYESFISGGAGNLCTNPGFEDSTQFIYGGYSTFNTTATYVRTGSRSMSLAGNSTQRYIALVTDKTSEIYLAGDPSQKFYVEFYVKTTNVQTGAIAAVGLGIWSYTNAGVAVTNTSVTFTFDQLIAAKDANGWSKCSGYITLPSTSTISQVRPLLYVTAKATSGTFYFDDVYVADVTESANINVALYNSNTPGTSILTSAVPSIDAAKITTGTFSNAMIASGLDAAKLTTGTLPIARIGTGAVTNTYLGSDINGTKITAGTVGATYIAALDTSKITTGTFGNAMISDLSGSKINTGTVAANYIAALDASKISTGTIATSRLPSSITTVGSGFIMRKTSGTINVSATANSPVYTRFPTSAYDSIASNTGDYTVSTDGSGYLIVTASNSGWYMVEVSFGIKQVTRVGGYRIAAAMYKGTSPYKIGSTVDYNGGFSAQIPFACQASFIVYLSAGESVTPAALVYSGTSWSGVDVVASNTNEDNYFSVSLLNRSLA